MNPIGFHLRTWASWTPDCGLDNTGALPALLRRRVTPLGRQALSAAWGLSKTESARLVFSSRHGEFSRTLSLLEAVANRTDLSPADFTLSVHHALVGLLSIAQGNHRGHTAVAAGSESFCFGLMEAAACLMENPKEPVVFVHYDEPLPNLYARFNETHTEAVALALTLSATGEGEPIMFHSRCTPAGETRSASHALDFLNFLTSGAIEGSSVGEHQQWLWTRHAVA